MSHQDRDPGKNTEDSSEVDKVTKDHSGGAGYVHEGKEGEGGG